MNPLAQYLQKVGVLKTQRFVDAFTAIDRKDFVSEEYEEDAYVDAPFPLVHGQTISQPYTVAFMLELLNPEKGEKILDMGSGSGWTTALLAYVVGKQGRVVGVERIPELVQLGRKNLKKYAFPQAEIARAKGKTLGLPKEAPFHKILVSAAATEIPQELLDQLKENGIMVLPVRNAILRVKKVAGKEPEVQRFEGFVFVPLL